MQRLGLTGGIGSGKSTVAAMLVECGAALVDTDAIARALTLPSGAAMEPISAAFGNAVIAPDGSLDRARMRSMVFENPHQKAKLEAILHPMIGAECDLQAAAAVGSLVVFDVPLLVESGRWRQEVDRVLVVDATADVQVARVMARSNWTEEMTLSVLALQASRSTRLKAGDAVIFNVGKSFDQLAEEVRALVNRWAGPPTR
ncbi:MAG: dephospho-CoA kinase [Variovorax sp.]|jgi:dephospho-CoA kinase|nr:dephospho-CoA kinase [Variovorax sp.]